MAGNSRDEILRLVFEATGDEQLRTIVASLIDIEKAGGPAAESARALLDQFAKLSEDQRSIENLVELKAQLGAVDAKLTDAKNGLEALNKEFAKGDESSGKITASFAKAEAQVKSLQEQHNLLTARVTATSGALQKNGVDVEHLDSAHRGLQASMGTVTTAATTLTAAHEKTAEATEKTGEAHKHAGEKAREAGTAFEFAKEHLAEIISVATAVELALKGIEFGSESLKNAEAVEVQLSRVKATAKGAADEFEHMSEAVEKAAQIVNVSSQESASGLAALVGQGLSAKDAIAALVPTLQLAKIATIDVATAAHDVAGALKAFNVPAEDSQHIVDLLTAASHGAAGGLGAISEAVVQLAPDAKTLGLSIEQIVGIVGLLSSKGIESSRAMRELRTIFQELQNPTSNLRVELLSLGDGTNSFDKAVTALTSGTPRANQALLSLSGGARTVIEALGQAGPQAISKFTAELEKQNGVAERSARTLDDNLSGASKRFGLSIEAIGERLAKPVLEPFTKELDKLAGELNKFAESPDFKEIEEQVADLAKTAAAAIDKFVHGIDWKNFVSNAKEALTEVVDKMKSLAESAETIATAVNKVGDVIGGTFHTVAAVYDEAASTIQTASGDIVKSTGEVVTAVGAVVPGAKRAGEAMNDFGDSLEKTGQESGEAADKQIKAIGTDLKDLVGITETATKATHEGATAHDEHAAAAEHAAKAEHAVSAEAQAVIPVLHAVGTSAKESATGFDIAGKSLEELEEHYRKFPASQDAVKTAFTDLKISSQKNLQDAADAARNAFAIIDQTSLHTAAGLADRQRAFLAYAQAALAASANLDQGAQDSIKSELESKASALGLGDQLASLEKQILKTANAFESLATAEAGLRQVAENHAYINGQMEIGQKKAEGYAGALKAVDDQGKSLGERYQALAVAQDNTTDSTQRQHLAVEKLGLDMEKDAGISQQLAQAMAATRAEFLQVSDAAAHAFDGALEGALKMQGILPQIATGATDTTNALERLRVAAESDVVGIDKYYYALAKAQQETTDKINEQRAALDAQTAGYARLANSADVSLDQVQAKFGTNLETLKQIDQQLRDGTYNAGLLGKQDLGPFQQAIEAAIGKVEALTNAEKQATQQLADLNAQLQDQIDQQNNDQVAVENRKYEKQRQQIDDLAAHADAVGKAQAEEALQRLEQIHQKALKDIADQAAAQKQANQQASSGSGAGGAAASQQSGGASSGGTTTTTISQQSSSGTVTHKVEVTLNGQGLSGFDLNDQAAVYRLAQVLAPVLGGIILQAKRTSGG